MAIFKEDIERVEEIKNSMTDMLVEMKMFARAAGVESRFNAYVVGNIEQAIEDFTGMGNYSIEGLLEDMRDEVVDEDDDDTCD